MVFNYIKVSFRLMTRNFFYSFISIFGLTIGLVSFYILWQYGNGQLKSDKYHNHSERIARIGIFWEWNDEGVWYKVQSGALKSTLALNIKNDFPEVESYVRILQQPDFNHETANHNSRISLATADHGDDRIFKEDRAIYSDANLFEFFSIPLIFGTPGTVLTEPGAVVLSRTTAKKYFTKPDPRGELLKLNDSVTLKVTGVFEDLPDNTHLWFDLVIANAPHIDRWNTSFLSFTTTYVRLSEESFTEFENKLNRYSQKYWGEVMKANPNTRINMFVQPLTEVSFSQSLAGDLFPQKSKSFLYTLCFISLTVLLMAWINYINLSISRTAKRFKEIAARKVSGANQRDIVKQFLIESTIIYGIAVLLSLTLIQLLKGPIHSFFNITIVDLGAISLMDKIIFVSILVLGIFTSGLYPVYASRYLSPSSLFKLSKRTKEKRTYTSVLSVVQFSAAIVVIMLGLVVALQLNKVMRRTSELDKAVVIIESPIHKSANYASHVSEFRNILAASSGIQRATLCTAVVGDNLGAPDFEVKRTGTDHYYGTGRTGIDEHFLALFNIKLLAGRNFVKDDRSDVIIISRRTAQRLGYAVPGDAVGAKVHVGMTYTGESRKWQTVEVIGVTEDIDYGFHFKSHGAGNFDDGMTFLYSHKLFSKLIAERIAIQIDPSKTKEVMKDVQAIFEDTFTGNVLTWYFHDDYVNRIYGNEEIIRNQIILFTSLAIVIASFGLLGMVSFEVIERKKEIGIRKVLGAQVVQIGILLLRSTGYQILAATFIALPVGYFLSKQYIEKFSRQIDLSWWHFAFPILLLALVLLLTILSSVWKAVKSSPTEALKHE